MRKVISPFKGFRSASLITLKASAEAASRSVVAAALSHIATSAVG
jgi:hypothetical protein